MFPVDEPVTVKDFLHKHVPEEDPEVLAEAVERLAILGLVQAWQVSTAPKEILSHAMPALEAPRALTGVMYAQQKATQQIKREEGWADELRRAAKKQTEAARSQRKAAKRSHRSRSASSSEARPSTQI